MKKRLSLTAVLLAMFCLGSAAPNHGFSNWDFRGKYVFDLEGTALVGPVTGPLAAIGVLESDGMGNIPFATRTINVNGSLILQDQQATGTYQVQPNGTATVTFVPTDGSPPASFDFVLRDSRKQFAVSTDPGVVAFGTVEKQRRW